MAKYRIHDTLTGKTVTVSGDSPPTEGEALQIFGDAGLRDQSQQEQPKALKGEETNPLATAVKNIPLLGGMLDQPIKVAQDIGTGIRNMTRQPEMQKNEQTAAQLEQQAMATQDMAQRKALLQQANNIRVGISAEAGDISRSFTTDVNQNPLWRGVKAGAAIGTTADLVAAPLSMLLGKLGVSNPALMNLAPKALGNTPVLGTTQLGPNAGILQRGAVHAAHGGGEGALFGLGQQGETLDQGSMTGYTVGGAVAEPLLSALFSGMMTKGGVGKKLEEAYTNASKVKGNEITKNDIIVEAVNKLRSKSAQKLVKKIVNDYDADIVKKLPKDKIYEAYSPTEAWGVAKDIQKSRGPSIFDYITGPSTEKQSAKAVRDAISELLKDVAPDAKYPAKIYSLYSKGGRFGGSPAKLAFKYMAAPALIKLLTQILSGGTGGNNPSSYTLNTIGAAADKAIVP